MPKSYPTPDERRERCLASARRTASFLDGPVSFEIVPNVAAAGPCPACLIVAAKGPVNFRDLLPVPLLDCDRMDQCGCLYRLHYDEPD